MNNSGNKKQGLFGLAIILILLIIVVIMIILGINNAKKTEKSDLIVYDSTSKADSSTDVNVTTKEADTTDSDETSKEISTSKAGGTAETATAPATENDTISDDKPSGFLNNKNYPEVVAVVEDYLYALMEKDMDAMVDLLTDATDFTYEEGEFIESYDNINCYLLKGITKDEFVVYCMYDLKIYNIDTPAPTLSRFYVKKSGGRYRIQRGDIDGLTESFLAAVNQYDQVLELISRTDKALIKAKRNDKKLKEFIELMN